MKREGGMTPEWFNAELNRASREMSRSPEWKRELRGIDFPVLESGEIKEIQKRIKKRKMKTTTKERKGELNFTELLKELKEYFLPENIREINAPEGHKNFNGIGKLIYCDSCSCVYYTKTGSHGYSHEPYEEGWRWYSQKEPKCSKCGSVKTSNLEDITLEVFDQGLKNLVVAANEKIKYFEKQSEEYKKKLSKIPKDYYYIDGPTYEDVYKTGKANAAELTTRLGHLREILPRWFSRPIEKRREEYDMIKHLKERQNIKEEELRKIEELAEEYDFEISKASSDD